MIPLWQHIGAVIALLVSNGFTAWCGLRRIRELQDALRTRDELIGVDNSAAKIAGERMQHR